MEPSDFSSEPTPQSAQQQAEAQKLIQRITRLAGFAFFAIGVVTLLMGGDIILGSVLTIIGLTDIVLVPHIIEKVIAAKLKQRQEQE